MTLTVASTTAIGTYPITVTGTGGGVTQTTTVSLAVTGLADLTVSSIRILTASPFSGGTLSVSDTITNQGLGAAGSSSTGFYLSTDGKTVAHSLGLVR